MEDFRSKSCGDGRNMQMEPYYGGGGGGGRGGNNVSGMNDLRCQSATYTTTAAVGVPQSNGVKDIKLKKGKNGGSSSKSWSFNDPELQRKKRVASYKVYAVQGNIKGSFRKSFRWLKDRFSAITGL